jgi:hypothetical protein
MRLFFQKIKKLALQRDRVLNLALPNGEHRPASLEKFAFRTLIPLLIALELGKPVRKIGARLVGDGTSFVLVPKAAMNEYHLAP